jgi:hypothetical protein
MLSTFAYEAAGASRARLSLRPLMLGASLNVKLAPVCGEIAKLRLFEKFESGTAR